MGADIHVAIEESWVIKERRHSIPDEQWAWYLSVRLCMPHRNYDAFGILAEVRGSVGECLYPPRGLPSNVSKEVAEDFQGNHSHSYLYLPELLEVEREMKKNKVRYSDIGLWIKIMKHLERDPHSLTRLVFSFDS